MAESVDTSKTTVDPQHLDVLRLTRHLAGSDENFCDTMQSMGVPIEIHKIQRRPVPVMVCMRVAAAKICGTAQLSFLEVIYLQLRFSYLIQDSRVREKLQIEWQPAYYAVADPSKLTDSIEDNTSRLQTLSLVEELIGRIEQGVPC